MNMAISHPRGALQTAPNANCDRPDGSARSTTDPPRDTRRIRFDILRPTVHES